MSGMDGLRMMCAALMAWCLGVGCGKEEPEHRPESEFVNPSPSSSAAKPRFNPATVKGDPLVAALKEAKGNLQLALGLIAPGRDPSGRDDVRLDVAGNVVAARLQNLPLTDEGLSEIAGLTRIETLFLRGTKVTSAGMEHLKGMTNLSRLSLSNTEVGDDGLAYLPNLGRLQFLYMRNTQVTGAGLRHLKRLPFLQHLHLEHTKVDFPGLLDLGKALPNCRFEFDLGDDLLNAMIRTRGDLVGALVEKRVAEQVQFNSRRGIEFLLVKDVQLTDAGFRMLANQREMKRLWLINSKITNKSMPFIRGMPALEELVLKQAQIDDNGLAQIAGNTRLTFLSLQETQVTDAGIKYLRAMSGLESLSLNNTTVSDEGVAQLRQLRKLETLALNGTQVTDASLAVLESMSNLKEIHLQETAVTNDGLERLSKLNQLGKVYLANSKVDVKGVRLLQKALPACKIFY